MSIIRVDGTWKLFRIAHEARTSILDHVAGAAWVLAGKRYSFEEFWALKDVSFQVEHGESLGVIGPNGSGKSTLLKLIARVLKPDKGRIETVGSLAPVLELGIGFHRELTVKENAMVYGVIMGLSRSQIKQRMDSVLDFSGLNRFQDTRLKHLSTGMQVRLAFAIAIQSEPDIFLIDEALAVGDIAFQEQCLAKFREFKKERKSMVLVSQNLDLIKSFCGKSLYLRRGEIRILGATEEATEQYLKDIETNAKTGGK